MRVVAQARGVPRQVAVTIALRTGSPLETSMTVPEMMPCAAVCASQVTPKMHKRKHSFTRSIIFLRRPGAVKRASYLPRNITKVTFKFKEPAWAESRLDFPLIKSTKQLRSTRLFFCFLAGSVPGVDGLAGAGDDLEVEVVADNFNESKRLIGVETFGGVRGRIEIVRTELA